MSLVRSATLVAAACLLLTGCGSSGTGASPEEESTEASTEEPTGASSALAEPGDDLLEDPRRGVELAGIDQRVTWRFPESYEAASERQATASDGDVAYEMTIGAQPDAEQRAEGERFVEEATDGVEAAVEDVEVNGLTFTLATFDEPDTSLRAFFHTPEGDDATYAVLLRAGVSLEETPDERLEELYQVVGSLEWEPKEGMGG